MVSSLETAKRWIAVDGDPETRKQLERWLADANIAALDQCFSAALQFGTAGLRATLGPGPNQMNTVVVETTTRGLLNYLSRVVPSARERGVVIGCDARRGSQAFLEVATRVAHEEGYRVFTYTSPVPTPLVGYACLAHKAAAGIMITASHNPPEYNGYKVYFENGCQIVPPHDQAIESAIAEARETLLLTGKHNASNVTPSTIELDESAYFVGVQELLASLGIGPEQKALRVAYTALHGVGGRFTERALQLAGVSNFFAVAEQQTPDGNFPTVRFPNPEEPGATDLLLALAQHKEADIALANDPDADRLACAAKGKSGAFRMLTGNELGVLLADFVFERTRTVTNRLALCSIVSSPMMHAIAKYHGVASENALTGFKWISNVALLREQDGNRFVFGYEEALGYTVGTLVRDKDGVATAAIVAVMADALKREGKTLFEKLDELYQKHGVFLGTQVNRTFAGTDGAERIERIMQHFRTAPQYAFAGQRVTQTQDLAHVDLTKKNALPSTNAILFQLDGGHRIMVRPSGTEPKIKYYFDITQPLGERSLDTARESAGALMKSIVSDFVSVADKVAS